MKTKQELLSEISRLTLEIENKYPELYVFLDEMPDTLPVERYPTMSISVLENHLESLERMIEKHRNSHKSP